MKRHWKRHLISIITFVAGAYFFLEWLLPEEIGKQSVAKYHSEVLHSLQIVGIMSIGLGVINLLQVYGRSLVRKQRGWFHSLALLLGFFGLMFVGIQEMTQSERSLSVRQKMGAAAIFSKQIAEQLGDVDSTSSEVPGRIEALLAFVQQQFGEDQTFSKLQFASDLTPEERSTLIDTVKPILETSVRLADRLSEGPLTVEPVRHELLVMHANIKSLVPVLQQLSESTQRRSRASQISSLIQQGLWVPLASAMFALLAFYIASAAYRAFRIRSAETACIMAAAVIVILGQIPHGPLYISESLPAVRLWILEYINAPAFRAIYIGSTVAGLAMAVRIWFSIERSPMDVGGAK